MGFLTIGNLELKRTYNYKASLTQFSKTLRTANNRLVQEVTGYKWVISVGYDYFSEQQRSDLISILKQGLVTVTFYSPETGEQLTSDFVCTSFPMPKIARFKGSVPDMWNDVSFTLEEV